MFIFECVRIKFAVNKEVFNTGAVFCCVPHRQTVFSFRQSSVFGVSTAESECNAKDYINRLLLLAK